MIPVKTYQGAGNDFVIVKNTDGIEDVEDFVKKVCHRRFGIGADGFMYPEKSDKADVFMNYFNSDGSRAEMCGNGLRCFAKFVYEEGIVDKKEFTVDTLAGIMEVKLNFDGDKLVSVTENLGVPSLTPESVPVTTDEKVFINQKIKCLDREFEMSAVLMAVPHVLILVDELNEDDVLKYGPLLETHEIFPRNANINFVKKVSENEIDVDFWGRGDGRCLACGTGSCAIGYLMNYMGFTEKKIKVNALGGVLYVEVKDGNAIELTGPAEFISEGMYNYK
jgi:diaminopimelate epimerase